MVSKRSIFTASEKLEPKKPKVSKADASLLEELSRHQTGCSVFYYLNALLISVLPLWMFSRILGLDLEQHAWRIGAVTATCSCFLFVACDEIRKLYNQKLKKRPNKDAEQHRISNMLTRGNIKTGNSVLSLMKTEEYTNKEACGFSMFYNDSYFLALVLLLSNVGFQKLPVENNYVVSMILSALIVVVISAFLRTNK